MPKIISEEKIFRAVLKVISEKSYIGASTKQMAEEAGVSEITLFRKYGTKAGIVKTAVKYMVDINKIAFEIRYTGNLNADLIRVVDIFRDMINKNIHFMIVLFSDLPRVEELRDVLELPGSITESFGEMIKEYHNEGFLFEEHPRQTMSALIGPLIYDRILSGVMNKNISNQMESREYVKLFLTGRKKKVIRI
ncbi:MAG: helix-turn-helix domain containing protein [Spirochaetales bacterium]|uniref:Helix-turn-helix domain containing protein n=1 Tax=Candidatus Thalassospirochaeta sargassi TaxID=3119039 RepID=A0AAJ1IAX6_9SPIO|nr:helix-turn-helix domain containing protein [Spirochaetales bacterium]